MTSGNITADRRVDLARALADAGDPEGAASVLAQAGELVPSWPPLWYLLGESRAAGGDRAAAIRAFVRCLALDPADRLGAGLCLALRAATAVPPRLPPAFVEALFDDYAGRFDRALLVGLAYRGPALIADALAALGRPADRPEGAVLDLGCGTGLVGERLRLGAAWLEGVDLSAGMLRRARAKGLYDALTRADVEAYLERTTRRFDVVVAGDVLNYIGALEPLFRRLAAALADGGVVVVTIEALDGGPAASGVGLLLRESRRFAHDPAYVAGCAGAAGLSVLHARRDVLRQDRGAPVAGYVMAFGKAAGAAPSRGADSPAAFAPGEPPAPAAPLA